MVIRGTNFTDGTDTVVIYGGITQVQPLNVVSSTEIRCHLPPCGTATGPVPILLTTVGGAADPASYDCGGSIVFVRGDANCDGVPDIADAIAVLGYLFSSASVRCEDALDANDDGKPDIADAIFVLGYLFSGGANPPSPFPTPGTDPTADDTGCAESCVPAP